MSSVTSIKPEDTDAEQEHKGLLLRDSTHDAFSTLDVVNGLRGVCEAADKLEMHCDFPLAKDLAAAAKILSSILVNRVDLETPWVQP